MVYALLAFALLLSSCSAPLRGPPPRPLVFPEDHGPHPGAQTEWWYLQGVLRDDEGRELSVFTSSVVHDPRRDRVVGVPVLTWGARLALLTGVVADLDTGASISARRGLGLLPGPRQRLEERGEGFGLQVRRWRTEREAGAYRWELPVDGGSLSLWAHPTVPPLEVGAVGQEGPLGRLELGSARFSYYALPRVRLEGTLERHGELRRVEGTGWLDHQWGFVYAHEYGGWRWVALELDDGTDLLVSVVTPRAAGVPSAQVGVIRRSGEDTRTLADLSVEVLAWSEPRRGVRYPTALTLRSSSELLRLEVRTRLDQAEWSMVPVPIWEAPATATGELDGSPVAGTGFYEVLQRGDPPARRLYQSGVP